jgi:translocator protein
MPNNSQRIKQYLVVIATAGVIFINYLAGTGYINDKSPAYISDKYPTAITPSGYAFTIWSLIYLGLAAFSIYQTLPKNTDRFAKIRTLYIANCALNCLWIYLWHYEQIPASLAVMFALLATLIFINSNLRKDAPTIEFWLVNVPFNIYFGWITVATILNFTVALIYLGVKTSDFLTTVISCILLIAATALGVIMRGKFENAAYPLTVAWALIAIGIKQSVQTMIVTVAALCVAVLLISAMSPLLQTKKQPS